MTPDAPRRRLLRTGACMLGPLADFIGWLRRTPLEAMLFRVEGVAWQHFAYAGGPPEVPTFAELRAAFAPTGMTPVASTPAALAARIAEEQRGWPRVPQVRGIRAEP